MMALPDDEVHVWPVALNAQPTLLGDFENSLSPDERSRAARFHFVQDRQRYILTRATLRSLLSCYTSVASGALNIEVDAFGKPRLTDAALNVHFNLSHSQDYAVFAIARAPIGIDLEHIRPFEDARPIAQAYFLPSETRWLHAQPSENQNRAFFQLWTCKEAYLKAMGAGLSAGLDAIDTHPDQHTAATIWHPITPTHHLQSLDIIPNCACALVAPTWLTRVVLHTSLTAANATPPR